MQETDPNSTSPIHQVPNDKEILHLSDVFVHSGLNSSKHISIDVKPRSQEINYLEEEEEKDKIEAIQASSNDKLNFTASSPIDNPSSHHEYEEYRNPFDKTSQDRGGGFSSGFEMNAPGATPPLDKLHKSPFFSSLNHVLSRESTRDQAADDTRPVNQPQNNENNGENNNVQQGSQSLRENSQQPDQLNQHNSGLGTYNDIIIEPFEVNTIEEGGVVDPGVIEDVVNREVMGRFKRIIGYSLIQITVFTLLYLTAKDVINLQVLIGLIMIWPVLEIYQVGSRINRGDYRIKSKRFKYLLVLDWAYLFLFILLCSLKLSFEQIQPTFAILPGFLNIILYFTAISLPPGHKFGMIAFKLILFIQALMIGTKLDDRSKLNWGSTFFAVWIIFIILLIITCFYILFFGLVLYMTSRGRSVFVNMPAKTQIVGILWYLFVSGTAVFYFVALLKFIHYLDGDRSVVAVLERVTLAGLIYSGSFLVLTILCRNVLKAFMRSSTLQRMGQPKKSNLKYMVNFEVTPITKSTLFTIVSQTYFVSFEESLTKKNKEDLRELRKRILRIKNHIVGVGMGIETVNREKIKEKLMRVDKSHKPSAKTPTSLQDLEDNRDKSESEIDLLKCKNKAAAAWTVNDLHKIQQPITTKNSESENDNLCFICCVKKADAIYVDCGHAGICMLCAQESWKKHNKCVTCRKGITKVAKVEIVKGLDIGKVLYTVIKNCKVQASGVTGNATASNGNNNNVN